MLKCSTVVQIVEAYMKPIGAADLVLELFSAHEHLAMSKCMSIIQEGRMSGSGAALAELQRAKRGIHLFDGGAHPKHLNLRQA